MAGGASKLAKIIAATGRRDLKNLSLGKSKVKIHNSNHKGRK